MKKIGRFSETENQQMLSNDHLVGVRTTGRIKKPKAVFDPSDNYLPRAQRTGSVASATAPSNNTSGLDTSRRRKSLTHLEDSNETCPIKKLRHSSILSTNAASSSTVNISPEVVEVCYLCLKKEAKRGTYAKNKLIACMGCDKKVHKLCMAMDFDDLDTLRQHYKCDSCRSCDLCDSFDADGIQKQNDLITCSKCIKSFHWKCIPNIQLFQPGQRDWKCQNCTLSKRLPVETIREIIGDEPTGRSMQQQQHASKVNECNAKRSTAGRIKDVDSGNAFAANINAEPKNGSKSTITSFLPSSSKQNESLDFVNVKEWTVDQVTEYFARYFPNEAYVFKEQEIDGVSLLLLKRSDVIKKLPIKLGPSLRIYSLILKVQTQLNDITLGWDC